MKMQLMNETLRYDVLHNETKIKKKNLLKQNYLFRRNFTISKIHKNFTICVTRRRYEDQTHMPPANLFPQPPHSGWGNTTQYTLANSNLHQPFSLVSFT